jgi:hypothetical protein
VKFFRLLLLLLLLQVHLLLLLELQLQLLHLGPQLGRFLQLLLQQLLLLLYDLLRSSKPLLCLRPPWLLAIWQNWLLLLLLLLLLLQLLTSRHDSGRHSCGS